MDTADSPHQDTSEPVWVTLVSGSIAATTATFAKQPIARVKFLKQVSEYATKMEQISLYQLYGDIVKNEGFFKGLFRGSFSACFRNIPHSMMTYTFYPKYRRLLNKKLITSSNKTYMTNINNAFSGSLASMSAHILSHPMDTIRVRIAVQYEFIEYPSIYSTFCSIYTMEGINGFYRGLFTTLIGAIFRAGVGFGIYETLKNEEMKYPILGRLSIGFMAGTSSTFLAYPFDSVRRRQQVFGTNRNVTNMTQQNIGGSVQKYRNVNEVIKYILKKEGFGGFYKGIWLALIKSPLAAAISLTTNDYIKEALGWRS